MGLFGLLATIFTTVTYSKDRLRDTKHDTENRDAAQNNNSLLYTDSHGYDRLTSTGEKVCYHGGKVYSTKHPNVVLHDARAEYFLQINKERIEQAKNQNKRYAMLYYAKDEDWTNTYCCKTEISTMRKYDTDLYAANNWKYFICYKEYDGYLKTVESKIIPKTEYVELGGYVPTISTDEYCAQKTKEARELKKLIGGIF